MSREADQQKPGRYEPAAIEARWQRHWADHAIFRTPNPSTPGFDPAKPKFYILDMFPYPSGSGLHVGHPVGYCATDIVARYKRMCGFNVLHPMGFDAFGLPAEQYAIEHNVHPALTTRQNIERYRQQLRMFGFSYDWDREIATCDPTYYKFTQWIFLKMYSSWYDPEHRWTDPDGRAVVGRTRPIDELVDALESGLWGVSPALELVRNADAARRREWKVLSSAEQCQVLDRQRLAYLDEVPVNWCPALGTVLANEEVTNEGRSERGNHPVYRRPLRQWMLRITRFADRLLTDLDELDWPEPIKIMQRNWIGKSTGASVVFPLAQQWSMTNGRWVCRDPAVQAAHFTYEDFPHAIRVYTTRPDTLFGATYMVLAPEHELVDRITTHGQRSAVQAYVDEARNRSDLERTASTQEKTGVFTGAYAINPVNGRRIPVWVADYVLMSYGTGAIMAVPGSDTRDFAFACKFDLPVVAVVEPTQTWVQERLSAMTAGIDEAAATGFDQVAREFPEWAEEIAARRHGSTDLGHRTLHVLQNEVGLDRLIAHYVQHPKSWAAACTDDGVAVHSPGDTIDTDVPGGVCVLDGLPTAEAKERITTWLEASGLGRRAVNYKLRDWIFSRQKYWGEPFPILHAADGEIVALPESELPVELPAMSDFRPTAATENASTLPEPPLARAGQWVNVKRNGRGYRRDVNTMPQWAGSCWYYLRFLDSKNTDCLCDLRVERYWMPIDLYVGGAEHAVLHLLYARFWHKVLFDLGYASTREPFRKLFNQGMIQSFAYRDSRGVVVGPDQVEERGEDQCVLKSTAAPVTRIVAKMSKALKNVVTPDEVIAEWGADTFRLYEMYMGPLESSKPWNTRDVPGLFKLCQRIWRLVVDEQTNGLSSSLTDDDPDRQALRALHKLIKRVTGDVEQLKFNTAIAALFDFVNFMTPRERRPRSVIEPFVLVLSPFAPHLAEELWHRLGHSASLAYESWPAYDETLARDEEVEIGVQLNGKLKARVTVLADADDETIRSRVLAEEKVAAALEGKSIRKFIVIKGRLVNIVAN